MNLFKILKWSYFYNITEDYIFLAIKKINNNILVNGNKKEITHIKQYYKINYS